VKAVVKVAKGPGHVELRDVPAPRPQRGEVVLQVGAVGVCGTDLHILAGEYPCRPPVILGHEFAGTVAALGGDVTRWKVGDRVVSMPFAVVCGTCRYCLDGEFGQCEARLSYGSGVNGALAECVAVKETGLYPLPEGQDFVSGSVTEPLACVTKAVFDVGELQPGESVVVVGPGPIGLLTTQVAKAAGASVALVGLRSDVARLDLGRSLGADSVFYADDVALARQLDRADVAFECSGAGPGFRLALRLARRQGRVVQVGLFGRTIEVDLDSVVFKDLTVRGSFASNPASWERALSLMGSGLVDTRRLVSDVFALKDWKVAFDRARGRSGLKVVIQPSSARGE